MRQSRLFTKTRREAPKDEVAKNAQLLTMGGFVNKEMAGVYSYLPLGLRVLRKIENIIREEMNNLGAFELHLTALQDSGPWKASGRWDDEVVDVWFKTKLANDAEIGLANTHEEPLTNLMKHHVSSYKDLPAYVYQIQTKFRNELRAKSGLMRGREFLMKDLYSFNSSEEELEEFYEQCAEAYAKIFKRAGIGDVTYRTFASGGAFSKFSDEFQALSDAGEDIIYVHEDSGRAVNKEVYNDEVLAEVGFDKNDLVEKKAIEIGNIFKLGTRFSDALGLVYKDEKGDTKPVIMGSYGIGVGRLMGAIVELYNDDNGILWPEEVAPFSVHLVGLMNSEDAKNKAEELYKNLLAEGTEVLYDDRQDISAGEKFADSDLIGIPLRAVLSERSLEAGGVEVKSRMSNNSSIISEKELLAKLKVKS
ncbi:MAG: aminoacyl--tRNA ligase-related protein [Candidatus Spechtbacterales bacterium]